MIAETLLFYEHVHVVADENLLLDLLRFIGVPTILKMLDLNIISLTYIRETLGVVSNSLPTGMQFHNFAAFELGGKTKKRLSNAEVIERVVERVLGKSRETKRVTMRLLNKITFRSLGISKALPQGFPALVREDLHDTSFVTKAVEHTICTLVPEVVLPDRWTFGVNFASDESFIVGTTLDFEKLNTQYHKRVPPERTAHSAPRSFWPSCVTRALMPILLLITWQKLSRRRWHLASYVQNSRNCWPNANEAQAR